jgi:hypothetical protein
MTYEKENSKNIIIDESQNVIDRGHDYTLALWLLITKTGNYYSSFKN